MKLDKAIGNTPLIELETDYKGIRLLAKLEGNNPAGSVKDRPAFNMIKVALEQGDLQAGDHIIEATSGNTGIALAMAGKLLGVNVTLVLPDNSTIERIKTMRAYGAEVILTPAEKTIEYSRKLAEEKVLSGEYKSLNQFANENNWKAHYLSTGPEVWRDTNHEVTHFISSMGTTGTIMGVSTYLKEMNSSIQIIGAQPKTGDSIPGIRKWSKEMRPAIYNPSKVDQIIEVSREDAIISARELARDHGILGGMSSGGAYYIARKVADQLESGTIVFIVCDRGDRYLSTDLFC